MYLSYFLSAIYLLAALLLATYGFNSLVLTALFLRHRRGSRAEEPRWWPSVTVQLPVYNERWVVRRLLEAVSRLDYPRDRLQIQVLDDSDDYTHAMVDSMAARLRRRGLDVTVLHRTERSGYKAGALANGLASARGEFIAIFDADFVPPTNWLRRVVPYLAADRGLGFVQTRWGHINEGYSVPTRAQALALDGHFVVEQPARQRSGLLMNFNGSAGIWRRRCIEGAGGWSARTLCEDLDLSYRAQLAGWRGLYLPEVVVPAEVPPTVSAFKSQQRRWATGSVQCLRYLAGPVLRSRLSLGQKVESLIHMGGYLGHPLMLVLLLVSLPLLLLDGGLRFHLTFLGLASLGPPTLYILSQAMQGGAGWRRLAYLPVLVLLGTGLAVSSTRAVIRALRSDGGAFERTPKYSLVGRRGDWRGRHYVVGADSWTLGELGMAAYALVAIAVAASRGSVYAIPFLALYAAGFLYVAASSLSEARAERAGARRAALNSQPSRPWVG
ncbi:MAG: glycosyltransferase [Anaerolineae bacterium]|nr:glycosyltransferase [Anaerolineae bacterium]